MKLRGVMFQPKQKQKPAEGDTDEVGGEVADIEAAIGQPVLHRLAHDARQYGKQPPTPLVPVQQPFPRQRTEQIDRGVEQVVCPQTKDKIVEVHAAQRHPHKEYESKEVHPCQPFSSLLGQ